MIMMTMMIMMMAMMVVGDDVVVSRLVVYVGSETVIKTHIRIDFVIQLLLEFKYV